MMMNRDAINILLIEDNPGDADLIAEMLDEPFFELSCAARLEDGLTRLQDLPFSVILLDLSLPDSFGLETFSKVHGYAPQIPIVVLTGNSDENIGLMAVKAGAQDYLSKNRVDSELLSRTINFAIERKRFEAALTESRERLRAVVESVREAICHIDMQGSFTFLNSAWTNILQYPVETCLGRPLSDFVYAEDRQRVLEAFGRLLSGELDGFRTEIRLMKMDADLVWMEIDLMPSLDERQRVAGVVCTLDDITQRKKNEERLVYLATHDSLTGLPNRTLFEDRLGRAMTQSMRVQRVAAVILLDLDQFKIVNDSLGHDQGDALLRIVSHKLQQAVRATDTVARLGGDEFAIVLSELALGVDDAYAVASKIMQSFEQPVSLKDHELYVACSIGIAIYPKDGETVQQLVKNADVAMYQSKELGRKQLCFYSPEMNAELLERLTLTYDLRRAIDMNELDVYYQPKFCGVQRRVLGFEALLRWKHRTRGSISPSCIIPLAESSGLILAIGEWVLRTACAQHVLWREMGFDGLTMAVNLSTRQLWKEDMATRIANALHETGMDPASLELEITESAAMRDADKSISILGQLREMGITLSIDDFGTGYSSLSYLKRLPISTLKVDQSFVRDITYNADAAAIAKSIIVLAHAMNLQVIAEGVETEEQFKLLQRWQCNAMQGFLFSQPLSSAAAFNLLRQMG
jgi:diguanylate cyclase (GGDEF)-like protein/PAS domain S-box-containing protein